jgi:uncharacterized RDD family membrane protein YckC
MIEEIRYAGFWKRLVADCVDSILLDAASFLVGLMFLGIAFWVIPGAVKSGSVFESLNSLAVQVAIVVIRCGLALVYFTWATYRFGTTLGKRPFRIYVVTADDRTPITFRRSLVRCLSYAFSYLPLCAGFLMVLFQPEKRALHDLIAGTVSIIRPKAVLKNFHSSESETISENNS